MTAINRELCKTIRPELKEALEELGEKFDLDFDVGKIKFSSNDMNITLVANRIGEDGVVHDPEVEAFKRQAAYYGLEKDDLGKTFVSNGTSFRIVGLKPRNRKYPIMADRVYDGASYKFPANYVKQLIK